MVKKMELDAVRAELAETESMLAAAKAEGDFVGELQFEEKINALSLRLGNLADAMEHLASVALYFGGRPVYGSKGIFADFAGKTLDSFQELVTKKFASLEMGDLGKRGPVPLKEASQLMITNVARGSFGFILEEAASNSSLTDTALRRVLDDVTEVIFRTSDLDESVFEEVAESLDQRMLSSLKDLFHTLDESAATLRIVEGQRDFLLDHAAIKRARNRTEAMEINEKDDQIILGELIGLLPATKRFEFRLPNGQLLKGVVSATAADAYYSSVHDKRDAPVGKSWKARMKVREVKKRNSATKILYTLLALEEEVSKP